MKRSLPLPNTSIMKDSTYLGPKNLASSRVIGHKGFDNMTASETFDMKRIVDVIESTSKEQQTTIMILQENLSHYKETVDKL